MKPVSKISLSDIQEIVRTVCMVLRETNQFMEGLHTLIIRSLLRLHPAMMKQLFTYVSSQLMAQDLMGLLVPVYSPWGSNRREEEESIILNCNDYLQDLEGVYTTGVATVLYL